jgi:hypothetical protein
VPKIEIQLKKSALKRTKLVNMKAYVMGGDRETKNPITKRKNPKILSNTTNNRLEKNS